MNAIVITLSAAFLLPVVSRASIADEKLPAGLAKSDWQNLLKYAFNMNLSGTDSRRLVPGTGTQGLPSITSTRSGANTTLRVEFIRRIGSWLVYTTKRSSDLSGASWVTLTDTPTVTPINAAWERVLYEELLNTATQPKCFVVGVTLP